MSGELLKTDGCSHSGEHHGVKTSATILIILPMLLLLLLGGARNGFAQSDAACPMDDASPACHDCCSLLPRTPTSFFTLPAPSWIAFLPLTTASLSLPIQVGSVRSSSRESPGGGARVLVPPFRAPPSS